MGALRDRMIEEMKLRNFSAPTQKTYLYAVTRLAKYYGKAPDQLSKEEIRAFLVHLIVERKLSPNGLTGYCSGLRFFYNETLGWDENKLFIPPRKQSSPLAEVFSPEEIVRLIRAARGLKQRVLLMTAYSAGLRVSELVNLKINDIDPARMTLRIRQGKGGKDRYAILSENLLAELRVYWKRYRPAVWLFPNRAKNGPLSRNEAWHIFNSVKRRAGLKKGRGIHSLRACFATHLLEAGVDLRSIRLLMGHTSLMSTQRYLRLSPQSLGPQRHQLDGLPTVGFVVKIARLNQNKSLAVAQCPSQCSAVFCSAILPATSPRYSARSSLIAARNHLPYRPIILLLTTQ